MKTKQTGYHTLPNGLKLHFSINAWYNLEADTSMKSSEWLQEFGRELQLVPRNDFILLDHLTDIVLAAAVAYGQEEDEEVKLNRFKVRSILTELTGDDIIAISDCIFRNANAEDKLGKQMTPKK